MASEQIALDLLTKGWDGMLSGTARETLEAALPAWLRAQRWFGAKTRSVARVEIARWVAVPSAKMGTILPSAALSATSSLGEVILFLKLSYNDGSGERYQLPLAYSAGAELKALRQTAAGSIVIEMDSPTGPAALHDAVVREEFRQALIAMVEQSSGLEVEDSARAAAHVAATLVAAHESRPAHNVSAGEITQIAAAIQATHSIEVEQVAPDFVGHMPGASAAAPATLTGTAPARVVVRGVSSHAFASVRGSGSLTARIGSAEQSNTNILYGQRLIMKLFRRLQPGLNPDIEIGRFLTDVAHFDRIAPFAGEITLEEPEGKTSLAMLQGLVANEGDGWQWTQIELARFLDEASRAEASVTIEEVAGDYPAAARLLGQRTAEMHLALATPTDDAAFAAESYTSKDEAVDAGRLEAQIRSALDALDAALGTLDEGTRAQAKDVLLQREELMQKARAAGIPAPSGQRIRIHGDYHLGQVLRTQGDFVLLDFEGEPARSLEERRQKQSPLRDVAGMLRSFSYAAASALKTRAPDLQLQQAAKAWERMVCDEFLAGYQDAARASVTLLPQAASAQSMLNGYVLEKALYELLYELDNRPAWVGIPLAGILNFQTVTHNS